MDITSFLRARATAASAKIDLNYVAREVPVPYRERAVLLARRSLRLSNLGRVGLPVAVGFMVVYALIATQIPDSVRDSYSLKELHVPSQIAERLKAQTVAPEAKVPSAKQGATSVATPVGPLMQGTLPIGGIFNGLAGLLDKAAGLIAIIVMLLGGFMAIARGSLSQAMGALGVAASIWYMPTLLREASGAPPPAPPTAEKSIARDNQASDFLAKGKYGEYLALVRKTNAAATPQELAYLEAQADILQGAPAQALAPLNVICPVASPTAKAVCTLPAGASEDVIVATELAATGGAIRSELVVNILAVKDEARQQRWRTTRAGMAGSALLALLAAPLLGLGMFLSRRLHRVLATGGWLPESKKTTRLNGSQK